MMAVTPPDQNCGLGVPRGMVIAVPRHRPRLAFDKRPHERPQPSKAPRPPNMQGRFFAVCFRSLFCNADDAEGRTFCFDEGLPASTTGACDALKDSLPEAVRRLPAHTTGRYRVSRMSLGRWGHR